ncbi:MAG TPA: hypothetical protein VGM92_05040, partial [Candidatus Kapabacteria bacterium]
LFLLVAFASASAEVGKHSLDRSFERSIAVHGFKGKVWLTGLPGGKVEVRMRTWRTTCDTVPGHEVFPVLVSGRKEKFFLGKFGASKIPMLIFAVNDSEHPQQVRAVAYQVSPRGSLIGQLVVNDESIDHGHTDNIVSGRYALTAIDPKLGAIYSISSQSAKFEGFFVTYEKLRVRQWDLTINAFIETDQGFLRDRSGRLMQSPRFESWSDNERSEVFAANLEPHKPWMAEKKPEAKIIPAQAER